MKINEIPKDGSVSLKLQKDNQISMLSVEIYVAKENVIVLKPIIIDGKVLNLSNSDFRLELIYERGNEKPLIWRNISFGTIKIDNYPCVVLQDTTEGVVYNRRGTFRLELDVQGVLNGNEKIIVHDISTTGISFYTEKDNRKTIGSPVKIKFMGGFEEIYVSGEIIREVEGEERNMYGCMIKANLMVDKFMTEEQRRRVMRNRTK